jgi:hypothetical protein
MIGYLWRVTRGYRLHPWDSPYLKWRIETYWGTPAAEIDFNQFRQLVWDQRGDFLRFLRWAVRMR